MGIARKDLIPDGFSTNTGGMDGGSAPELLQITQSAKLINISCRNDFLQIRPPFDDANLLFDTIEQYNWWNTEVFQGSEPYLTKNNGIPNFEIVASVGGRIFSLRPNNTATLAPVGVQVMSDVSGTPIDFIVREVTPPTGRNSKMLNRAWFCQADKYMIIQDGQSRAIIYQQGLQSRRADPKIPEVPVGTIMVYGQNRLVVTIQGNKWKIGDLLGSKPLLNGAEVLQFTEDIYFNEGGYFALTTLDNTIQAMRFTQIGDSNTGQGELLIYAASTVSSLNMALPRDQWKNNPIQHVAFTGFGGVGDRSFVQVNTDVWGRAPDGVRSYIMTRREMGGGWQFTPQSREVSPFLENDSEQLLPFCSATLFDKRLLITFSPFSNKGAITHRGLVVISFHTVSALQNELPPEWDGAWTGLDILQILKTQVQAEERCWIFSKSCDGPLKLFELKKTGDFDNGCEPITAVVETRAFSAGDPTGIKFLEGGVLWMNNLKGDISVDIKWRPDYYPCWLDWHSFTKCYTTHECGPTDCRLPNLQAGYIRRRLPAPPDACNLMESTNARHANLFQFRIELTGNSGAILNKLKCYFQPRLERSTGDCDT